ncbi:MAG: FkbM family methyltransferase [Sphingobacteriaceae bacterium]|nr:FkbM family methyltransferase [Sphingobacteriaceae bacterium]
MRKLYTINKLLNPFGVELKKYNLNNNELLRRSNFFKEKKIDLIIDVGANVGSFGDEARKGGYRGKICSFEPIKVLYEKLEKKSSLDCNWESFNFALGDNKRNTIINISKNLHSNSILGMLDLHKNTQPTSSYINQENIEVEMLDNIFERINRNNSNIYLKIDTQGYESFVLEGAKKSLSKINFIQLEMSLKPLYDGQLLFHDLYSMLIKEDYKLYNVERGFTNESNGELMQLDGIFVREES